MQNDCPHHKLLLCASHACASLCVLVRSNQQLNQSGDGALLSQRGVVCRTQSQVADQTHCRLMEQKSTSNNRRSISFLPVKTHLEHQYKITEPAAYLNEWPVRWRMK